jgi:hypothetical protein
MRTQYIVYFCFARWFPLRWAEMTERTWLQEEWPPTTYHGPNVGSCVRSFQWYPSVTTEEKTETRCLEDATSR